MGANCDGNQTPKLKIPEFTGDSDPDSFVNWLLTCEKKILEKQQFWIELKGYTRDCLVCFFTGGQF